MSSSRCFIAILLLVFSGQSLALFMPVETRVNTDTTDTPIIETC